jgi:hypothetical protein
MAEGLELCEVVFAILTILVFPAVSESQSDSHNIPHSGKNNNCFLSLYKLCYKLCLW